MSDSNDTNELDNYGVWVKKPPKDIQPDADTPDFSDDSFSLDEIPDFNELDTDSAETDSNPSEVAEDFGLTVEGLTDETLDDPFAGVDFSETASEPQIESSESEEPVAEDSFNLDDITADMPLEDINFDFTEETGLTSEPVVEESASEEPAIEETFSVDDFETSALSGDEPAIEETAVEEPVIEETVIEEPAEEPVTEPSVETETIDIDLDGMEDGEIDLDNFLSDDSSSSAEETVDLSSFGMDDSSTDSVNLDDFLDGGEFSDLNATGTGTTQKSEEIVDEDPLDINLSFDESADSFEVESEEDGADSSADSGAGGDRSTGDDIDTESIDLSEFGIEGEEEVPVTGPEDAINEPHTETIDYDLKVSADTDEDTSVSMSDVISGNLSDHSEPEIEETAVETPVVEETPAETVSAASNDEISARSQELISKLVGELDSLKSEIKSLKTELSDLKSHEAEITIDTKEEENTGFFADGGDDDTIALSGDELDNILSTAEFLDETETAVENQDEVSVNIEEETSEEPAADIQEEIIDEPVIEETVIEEDVSSETVSDESVFDDSAIFEETTDDIVIEEPEESIISEELPDEIEIPKVEDISGSNDIYVSENSALTIDTTGIDDEITISPIDELFNDDTSLDSTLTSDKLDYIAEDENNPVVVEDDALNELDLPSPSLDDMETSVEEPVVSDFADEPVIEETMVAEPVIEETPVVASPAEPEVTNGEIPGDLKQDIKSVLSYMDQLLENLPEDKISEFAQSEHFVTYKKLFQELGLA